MLFVACILIIVIASDAKFNLIYDIVVIPSIIVAFVWRFFIGGTLFDMLLGALVGLIFFGLQYYLSGGKWIGFGDVKLSILLGVVFGWWAMLFLIAGAYIIGSITSLCLLAWHKKTLKSTLPLGVFLGIAALYILVYGTRPLERLLHL
jgi:prepilin signal peptidase PulO-like enzyme (type II secretory pathway)